jgi:hypothetical protein
MYTTWYDPGMKQIKPAMKNTNACMPRMGRHITTIPVTKRPEKK